MTSFKAGGPISLNHFHWIRAKESELERDVRMHESFLTSRFSISIH